MPLYSEHISNMYFSGSPSYTGSPYSYGSSVSPLGSSYSASYLNPGGTYSNHSSLGGYSRAPLSSRWISSAGRNYSPILSTISERGTGSPIRINSPRRIPIAKRTYGTTAYTPRPININTADIDVSKNRYRNRSGSIPKVSPKTSPKKENPNTETVDKENGPFMPRVDGKPETGIDSSPGTQRGTIKRGRTVVRLHTIKRRERDSPRKPVDDSEHQDEVSDNATDDQSNECETETQEDNTENLTWREKLSDDLVYKSKKEKKSLGTKLVEKFIIKDEDTEASPQDIVPSKAISESLPTTPLPSVSNTETSKSPDRRCSMELLAEQASLFDSLIRRENLSTTSLDLSKVGISDNSAGTEEKFQPPRKRKGSDGDNSLKTTKSDHSLHNSLKYFRDHKDTRQLSKHRSLKKSSSGGSICRLDSITEFPKELNRSGLPSIEESRHSLKKENTKPKPKLKPVITSSVEVSPPKSPLKFKVENVTVEEIPCTPKKEIIFTSAIEELPIEKEVNTSAPQRNNKNRKSIKKKIKTKNDDIVSPEPDDGNFWDKIGKRETVYLLRRKQYIDDAKEKHRRALFWFPEDDNAGEEENVEDGPSDGIARASLLTCDIFGSKDNVAVIKETDENQKKSDLKANTKESENLKTEISSVNKDKSKDIATKIKITEDVESEIKHANKEGDQPCETDNVTTISQSNDTKLDHTKKENDNENTHTTIENAEIEEPKIIDSCDKILTESTVEFDRKVDEFLPVKPIPQLNIKSNMATPISQDSDNEVKQTPRSSIEKTVIKSKTNTNLLSFISQEDVKMPKESEESKERQTIKLKTNTNDNVQVTQERFKDIKEHVVADTTGPTKVILSEKREDIVLKPKSDVNTSSKTEDKSKVPKDILTKLTENNSASQKLKTRVKSTENDKSAKLPIIKSEKKDECQQKNITTPEGVLSDKNTFNSKKAVKEPSSSNVKENITESQKLSTDSAKSLEQTETPKSSETTLEKEEIPLPLKKMETRLPLKKEYIPSTLKQEVIPSPLKKEEISSPLKKVAIPSAPKKEDIPSTLNQEVIPSPLKKEEISSPLKKVAISSAPKKEEIPSPLKKVAIPSPLKKEEILSPLKKVAIPSILKKEEISSTLKKEEIPPPLKKEETSSSAKEEAATSNSIVTSEDKTCPDSTIDDNVFKDLKVVDVQNTPVENIPHDRDEVHSKVVKEQENLGEDNKAENISKIEDSKGKDNKPVPEVVIKPIHRKPVKEEAAVRPLIATPRPLQKKAPQVIHSSSSSESSSEESSDDDDSDESGSSENSTEFYECENNPDGRTSTGSNDSGFDSSAPTSPAGFVQIKKDCDVNCHRKCEKLSANLCGVNQRLLVEALAARPSFRKGGENPGPSGAAQAQDDTAGILEQELEQSTAYGLFRKTGRFTPPARSIPRFRKYAIEDFNFIKVLGKGSFGKVLLAELRDTEYYYAVKCLKKDVVLEDDDVECTLIERKVLALGTNHPYLCHLFATFQTDSHLFFVMEYLNGGDLMFHIQQSGRFPESRARFYAAEIVSGLKFLHKRGIVYRDLKLDNILLDFDGHVRIADFGMCKLQIYLEKTADTFCGTPDYMAPEIIKGLKYNQTVDWWSFGVLLYEMLIGQSPFSGCDEDELFWSICNEMPSYPRFLSQEALTVLTRLLDKDARTRLGGVECMHGDVRDQDFFHQIHWDRLERRELEAPFKPRVRHPLDTQYFDRAFTGERPRLTAVEPHVLRSMDQEPFRGFSYTNPNATDR